MKTGKKTIKHFAQLIFLIVVMVGIVGCSSSDKTPTSDATDKNLGPEAMKAWGERYPLEYASLYSDYNLVKLDGKVHSHVNLPNKIALRHGPVRPAVATCFFCKTGDMTVLYDKYGDELFGMPFFTAEGGVEPDIAIWNCNTCHGDMDDPAGSLRPASVLWNALTKTNLSDVDPKNAVCGQCHNAIEPYRYLVGLTKDSIYDFDGYKYGYDADGVMKTYLENANYVDGTTVEDAIYYKDDQSKIVVVGATGHPDIEMFQNSNHQSLGLTCTSCHMTQEENLKGEEYTRHAASYSPLASRASLEFCLTCHKAQGIEDTQQMVKWVRGKQNAIVEPAAELVDKLAVLYDLIVEKTQQGNFDEATLDKARWAYTRADRYYKWQMGSAESPGIKVAMYTTDATLKYINRGIAEVDEAVALLNGK